MRPEPLSTKLWPKFSSLFTRIFLWTWAAMTLAGVILLEIETSRTQRIADRWRSVTADAFAFYALSAAKDHEDTRVWEAQEFLADLERRTGIRAWMFDEKGHEVSGYANTAYRRLAPARMEQIRKVMARTMESRVSEFAPLDQVTLAAHTARAPSGRSYTLVGELPVLRYGPWQARPHIQALRLLAVSLAAAMVSWLLSRRLTAPIRRLRTATHEIAEGNLSARASMNVRAGGDELDQLARDFDGMAHRVEVLLQEKEQLVGAQRQLLRDVSHELRSPLARLNMALELARDLHNEQAQAREQTPAPPMDTAENRASPLLQTFDRIERESTRLNEMIKQLLALSRLESGMRPEEAVAVDLAALVRSITADANFEAQRNHRFINLAHCDECTIHGYPELLHSAVENVVRNALLHTPKGKGTEIDLRLEPQGTVLLRVCDQGDGVPEDQLEAIFQPFYRTAEARAERSGGAGLGLAITRRAIESHHGTVSASNEPDCGLLVKIRLPLPKKSDLRRA